MDNDADPTGFYTRNETVMARAKEKGLDVNIVPPNECSLEQIRDLLRIMHGRGSHAVTVLRVEGIVVMAYHDPRYPDRNCYLSWREDRWASPEGDHLAVVSMLDGPEAST